MTRPTPNPAFGHSHGLQTLTGPSNGGVSGSQSGGSQIAGFEGVGLGKERLGGSFFRANIAFTDRCLAAGDGFGQMSSHRKLNIFPSLQKPFKEFD